MKKTIAGDVLSAIVPNVSNHRVFDSETSIHMTPNMNYFHSFVRKEGGAILMENDASCRIISEGTVWIHIFEGVIRTLIGVRYVLDLQKSMISLGHLAFMGCNVSIENDSLKVS